MNKILVERGKLYDSGNIRISCHFLYANKRRIIAGLSRYSGHGISYIIQVDLAANKWSILDCFSWSGSWKDEEATGERVYFPDKYELPKRDIEELIKNAKQPQLEAAAEIKENIPQAAPHQEEKAVRGIEDDDRLTLAAFRHDAPSMTGFREQLLSYRKSLPDSWILTLLSVFCWG